MKGLLAFLCVATIFAEVYASADNKFECDFPKPEYQISEFTPSLIGSTDYISALATVKKVYEPIFRARNCPLVLVDGWSDGEINAQAWQENGSCYVEIFGGLARFSGMTKVAVIEAACHEIGHHLGKAPYYPNDNMSVEGQADRYATKTCMKLLGISSAAPSLTLAKTLATLGGEPVPSRTKRAKEKVSRTNPDHPRAQCRLDEYDGAAAGQARRCCWYHGVCG